MWMLAVQLPDETQVLRPHDLGDDEVRAHSITSSIHAETVASGVHLYHQVQRRSGLSKTRRDSSELLKAARGSKARSRRREEVNRPSAVAGNPPSRGGYQGRALFRSQLSRRRAIGKPAWRVVCQRGNLDGSGQITSESIFKSLVGGAQSVLGTVPDAPPVPRCCRVPPASDRFGRGLR
jgi:hypothetical protein